MYPNTYQSLVLLCAFLCDKYDLEATDLVLHNELTGKQCHKWFVDHPEEWSNFKREVREKMRNTNEIYIDYKQGGYWE
jgi:N-acetylmuramoyl-L-alanine amidase CwlA